VKTFFDVRCRYHEGPAVLASCDERRPFWRISYGPTVNAELVPEIVEVRSVTVIVKYEPPDPHEPPDPKAETSPAVPAIDGMNV
jgi:hypothetical protein